MRRSSVWPVFSCDANQASGVAVALAFMGKRLLGKVFGQQKTAGLTLRRFWGVGWSRSAYTFTSRPPGTENQKQK